MPEAAASPRLLAWITPEQESLIDDVVAASRARPAVIVGPRADHAATIAARLDAETHDDLRTALQRDDLDVVWLAAPNVLTPDDVAALRRAALPTFSCVPHPAAIGDVLADPDAGTLARFVPLLRRSPGFRAAAEILEAFGAVQCVHIAFRCGTAHGTLFGRLFDAMDVLHHLCGTAEAMEAAIAGAPAGVPESLGGLRGHLTLNVRLTDDRCAAVTISDAAGSWFRGVTILGPAGCLRIHDRGFEWMDQTGTTVDAHDEGEPLTCGQLIGGHIRRALDNLDHDDPPPDTARLLALCEATRLSCRTGQGELPQKMLEMLSRL